MYVIVIIVILNMYLKNINNTLNLGDKISMKWYKKLNAVHGIIILLIFILILAIIVFLKISNM